MDPIDAAAAAESACPIDGWHMVSEPDPDLAERVLYSCGEHVFAGYGDQPLIPLT